MTRASTLTRRLVVTAILATILVLVPGGLASAEPTEDQKAEARADAAETAAELVCAGLPLNQNRVQDACVEVVTPALKAADWDNLSTSTICDAVSLAPGAGAVGIACSQIIEPLLDEIVETLKTTYDSLVDAVRDPVERVIEGAQGVAQGVQFIADPAGEFERIINSVRDSAISFYTEMLEELVKFGDPDFNAQWWVQSYAAVTGIALLISAFMALFLLKDASEDKISPSQLAQGLQYLVWGIVAMFFAPVIVRLLQGRMVELNAGIIEWGGPDVFEALLDAALIDVQAGAIPGGALVGLILFLLMLVGALLVFVMLLLQGVALYLTTIALGISFGMLAHPRWRTKALRVPMLVLGIMLAKPLLLFVLMVIGKMIDGFAPAMGMSEPFKVLGNSLMIIVCLLIVGLAPWTLFRFFPILPDGSEITPGDMNPVGALAGAGAGAAGTKIAMDRMSGGGGGGGSSPATSSAAPTGGGSEGSGSSKAGASSEGGTAQSDGGSAGGNASAGGGSGGSENAPAPKTGSAGVGAGGGAAGGAGAGGGAAGGAGAGAAGSSGSAATAGAGVGSGGSLLVAAAALKGVQMGAQGAKQVAESAGPQQAAPANEESAGDVNDHQKWGE